MKWIIVALLTIQLASSEARPNDGLVEIEKQRLVKFPEETFRYEENEQKSSEAKRILEEIKKINVALGYVKKQEMHLPSVLDSNQFLFPKPLYHPFHSQSNGGVLQPSIRNLNYVSKFQKSKSIATSDPKLYFYYYLPKSIQPDENDSQQPRFEVPVKLEPMSQSEYVKNYNPRQLKLIDYKIVGNIEIAQKNKNDKSERDASEVRLYFVPRQLRLNEKSMERIERLSTIRPYSKTTIEKQSANTKSPVSSRQKSVITTTSAPSVSSLKTPFVSFFNRPNNVIAAQKIEQKPIMQSIPLSVPQPSQQQTKPPVISNDDYAWSMNSSEENDSQENEKHIFAAKRKEVTEVQKEALKESGIIIQRLKVRKGGIAIAGPGGVATAGSGGTAIVGPGGYALTHPRSLTIAGPGAKVIAIPETTDLKDALLRTDSGKTYTEEGEVVATGPVIYYSPDNNAQI